MSYGVKVQGSLHQCLRILGHYAEQYNVTYECTFGTSPQTYMVGKGRPVVLIHFMWRYKYNEYDNSA